MFICNTNPNMIRHRFDQLVIQVVRIDSMLSTRQAMKQQDSFGKVYTALLGVRVQFTIVQNEFDPKIFISLHCSFI